MPCTFDQQFGRTPPKRLSIPSSRLSIQSFTSLSRPPALLSIRSPVLSFLGHPYVCNLYSHFHQPANQSFKQSVCSSNCASHSTPSSSICRLTYTSFTAAHSSSINYRPSCLLAALYSACTLRLTRVRLFSTLSLY